MKNSIDAKLLMQVFSKIERLGVQVETPVGNGFVLAGMQVATGYDGYDLYFFAEGVSLTLGFHNKYFTDAQNEQQIDAFIDRLKYIERLSAQNVAV